MIRNSAALTNRRFDIAIVGGGIQGACLAREAALRGYKVALLEQNDFGSGTSHNSLKLVHGGIRQLQHLDVCRVRESVLERRFWMRAAPNLVRPLPFAVPTTGWGPRSALAFWVAMRIHELIGWDRNRGLCESQSIPRGELLTSKKFAARFPQASKNISQAALWYDAQIVDTDRLLLTCIEDARNRGAVACNYLRVRELFMESSTVNGIGGIDMLSGDRVEIEAAAVINATGPWHADFLQNVCPNLQRSNTRYLKSVNLVLPRLIEEVAFGVRQESAGRNSRSRFLFITPWKDCSVIGTSHEIHSKSEVDLHVSRQEVAQIISDFSEVWSSELLDPDNVLYCYAGLLPAETTGDTKNIKLKRGDSIIDHHSDDGIRGLVSVAGVKYTGARLLSQRTIDVLAGHNVLSPARCISETETVLPGIGENISRDNSRNRFINQIGKLRSSEADFFFDAFGSRYEMVMETGAWDPADDGESFFRCMVRYSVRCESAVRLADVLLRRTDRAARGRLTSEDIQWCSEFMARELGWDKIRVRQEKVLAEEDLSKHHVRVGRSPAF
jgi:glycerol-3-phosphate dehydrogenase